MTVELTIVSRIVTDGEADEQFLSLEGILREEAKGFTLGYRDPEGDLTTLRLHPEEVRIRRSGIFSSAITVRPGTAEPFFYRTPYGALELICTGEEILLERQGGSGRVQLRYRLDSPAGPVSENTIIISFKECVK